MKTYHVVLSPLAFRELQDAKNYFNTQSDGLGDAFVAYFRELTNSIASNPFLFQTVYADKRRAIILRFRYNVIYVVHNDKIFILAILHSARNPNTWQDR